MLPCLVLTMKVLLVQLSGLGYFVLAVVSAVSTLAAFLVRLKLAVIPALAPPMFCVLPATVHAALRASSSVHCSMLMWCEPLQVLLYGTCAGAAYGVVTVIATSARIEDERRQRESGFLQHPHDD